MSKYYSGKFVPKNKHKYKGDINNITYRSSWELKYLKWLDLSPKVIEYSSEEVIVPYICPTDQKPHRYFLDFWVKTKCPKTGKIQETIIEIKPFAQTQEPVRKQGKTRKRLLDETKTFMKNRAKWAHAKAFANQKGWNFVVLTERDLGIK